MLTEQNQLNIVTVNGVEYEIEKMSDEVKQLLSNIVDLENRIAELHFRLQEAEVFREALSGLLENALSKQNEGDIE